ncbi:hypothetical protein DYB32_007793 [Aphanomyces invadans]|uniref:Protein kinase domain-containing protein n=1 Tax=Aphanomyces invadans TaxID=157072 RepID=A0A418AMY2_9STRA|nr:hypothetical protein DYB32_007793 [Aphanomyces invadans]
MTSVKERKTKPSATEFTFGRELGQGNFSRVFLATHKATKEVFAVKMIEKARIMRMKIRHPNIFNEVNMEKTVLNMLRHPNVVRMYHTFQDAANLYFLMEYVSNGELWDVLQLQGKQIGCTEGLAQFYGADIVNALEYMASRHIVHRDLWSLGCILYQLLAGETPFQGGSAYLTFLKVKAGTFDFPEFFSDAAKDLIAQLLQTQPQARPSFDAIKAHPFFHGVDFAHHMNATAPEPTPDDRFVVQTAQAIAAYVAGSSGPLLMAINELHPVFVVLSGNMTANDAAVDAKDTETRAQTIAAFQEVVNRALDPTIRVVRIEAC